MEAHHVSSASSFDFAADVLFGNLTTSEAAALRQMLHTLSEAAGRRASRSNA
jgi:hypothetical protein